MVTPIFSLFKNLLKVYILFTYTVEIDYENSITNFKIFLAMFQTLRRI